MTEEQLREIEARAEEYVDSSELVAHWYPNDMAALVAAYRELRALAAELAEALDRCLVSMTDAIEPMDVAGQLGAESLDRAREHGLLEAQG